MKQKIETPTPEDLAELAAMRAWVQGHYATEAQHLYGSVSGKINLLETILGNDWIQPTETLKLQCLGITLGDALAQQLGFDWVMVRDEYGRDPALRMPGTALIVFPLTMISKRVEQGEKLLAGEMFNQIIGKIKSMLSDISEDADAPPVAH